MKLVEILLGKSVAWPKNADRAYQSNIDSEIYFLNSQGRVIHRTGRNPLPIADVRGWKGIITHSDYLKYLDVVFTGRVKEAGGLPDKNESAARAIQRIENGLRKDFDIDSPEFAKVMFEKGWRK